MPSRKNQAKIGEGQKVNNFVGVGGRQVVTRQDCQGLLAQAHQGSQTFVGDGTWSIATDNASTGYQHGSVDNADKNQRWNASYLLQPETIGGAFTDNTTFGNSLGNTNWNNEQSYRYPCSHGKRFGQCEDKNCFYSQ